jgi:2-methylaconitate cis-trans-isomerase PrpF
MTQRALPAVFMRGGTSNALVFHAADLPADPARRDRVLLAAMGSPDPYGRQLDGMGGGVSSLSKVCIVAPSARADADIDFTFCQIDIAAAEVDLSGTCGNMVSALGAFAVDEGLIAAADGATTVRVWNTNLAQRIDLTFPVRGGRAEVAGDVAVPGVAGASAGVRVAFVDPAGKGGQGVLPTGRARDVFRLADGREVEASLVDSAAAVMVVRAADLGCDGTASPLALDHATDLLADLERLRRDALVRLGRAADRAAAADRPGALRIAMVAPPAAYTDLAGTTVPAADHDLLVRMLSAGRPHRAVPISSALGLATAAQIPDTLVAEAARIDGATLRLGTPSGVVAAEAAVQAEGGAITVAHASIWRTARRLMQGEVLVPDGVFAG